MTPRQSQHTKRWGTVGGERWTRGNEPPPCDGERVPEELSQARKFKLKVQASECSQHASTAISASATSPPAHQQGRVCNQQQLHWQTTASSCLARVKQLRITQKRATQLWLHYYPGWEKKSVKFNWMLEQWWTFWTRLWIWNLLLQLRKGVTCTVFEQPHFIVTSFPSSSE